MNPILHWLAASRAERAVRNLRRRHFTASYLEDAGQALAYVLEHVPSSATVCVDGSPTAREMGVSAELTARGCAVHDLSLTGLPEEESGGSRRQPAVECFLGGADAVTLDGEMVIRDASGDRAAAMTTGPRTVFIIAGVNRLVRGLDGLTRLDRMEREVGRLARRIEDEERRGRGPAAPVSGSSPDTRAEPGEGDDNGGPRRPRGVTTVVGRRPPRTDVHVLLVGQAIGF